MRSIVVASGKGGTGKTTLTAAFAYLAARDHHVVVSDADVEASNLPIALNVTDVRVAMFSGGAAAAIDQLECSSCGICAEVCRFGAIAEGPCAYAVDSLACEGCGRCARVCPTGAITMVPRAVGEACLGTSAVGPVAFGQLGPGQDLSGRLVTEVRRLAADAADRHDAELLLIDGPPGIGCPLIAAVANTDLVLAVAEPSVSGVHDLDRLAQLGRQLNLPVNVVLNKADLSEFGAQGIRDYCRTHTLPILGEVPFDPGLARLLDVMAEERRHSETGGDAFDVIAAVWEAVRMRSIPSHDTN